MNEESNSNNLKKNIAVEKLGAGEAQLDEILLLLEHEHDEENKEEEIKDPEPKLGQASSFNSIRTQISV